MTASTVSKQFSTINLAKLPAETKSEFEQIKINTKDFTVTGTDANLVYKNFDDLYQFVLDVFPGAIAKSGSTSKPKSAKPKTPAKPKVTAKPKVKTKSKVKPKPAEAKPKSKAKPPVKVKPKVAAKPKAKLKVTAKPPKKAIVAKVKPKVTAKPKVMPKAKAKPVKKPTVKANPDIKKREKLAALNKEIAGALKLLKLNDAQKMRIGRVVTAYQRKHGLGSIKVDDQIRAASLKLRLYKKFIAADKSKFKSIKRTAIGKLQLGKAKKKGKPNCGCKHK